MSTIDPAEVHAFAQTSQHWWDERGPFKPLHAMNPTRVQYIRDQVATHFGRDPLGSFSLKGITVLDIGCGGGLLCEPLSRLGAQVTGVDADAQAISVAQDHAQAVGLDITYRRGAVEDLVVEPLRYDVVMLLEIVEHVADVDAFVRSCASLVKPGGILVFSTLNRTVKSYAGGIILAEQVLRWVPPGTHDWDKFLKPSELAQHLEGAGFRVRHLQGISYGPLSGRWSLTGDLSINYIGVAVAEKRI